MMKIGTVLLASLGCAAACNSAEDEPVEITNFFDDFHAARYSRSLANAVALDTAALAHPLDGPLSFDRALAHTWHLAESGRDPSPDPAVLQAEAMNQLELFRIARENNSKDDRVGCFLGLTLVGAGRATQDDALLQEGLAVLDEAVAAWPEFNLFCLGLAYDGLPASDPDYAKAVEAALDNLDSCVGESVDRNNPDITPYLHQATDKGVKRACWNTWIAPHNAEGFYLWIGDLLVKQGRIDQARISYNNVKLIKEYPSWPYKSLLADRLSADLDAKAALYQDADPTNDPPVGGESIGHRCAYCHAATADE
jgi:hypothetical protein